MQNPNWNERTQQVINTLIDYIVELKERNRVLAANDVADAETIATLTAEASEWRALYEGYTSDDVNADTALEQILAKAEDDISVLKSA